MEPAEIGRWFEEMAPGLVLYAGQIVGRGGGQSGDWRSGGAEDVVQEVFVRLAGQERVPANVKAWLLLAVRRAALDATKGARRRAARDWAVGLARPMLEAGDRRELVVPAEEVEAALASLILEEREVVTMRIWNGATFEEIGGVMGLPVSTVYHRYRTALESMRARWEVPCQKK